MKGKPRPWRDHLSFYEELQVACLEATVRRLKRAKDPRTSVYRERLGVIRNRACQRARIAAGEHSTLQKRGEYGGGQS